MFLLKMFSVHVTAPLGPRELYTEVTPFLGRVLIFVVPGEVLALRKNERTQTACIQPRHFICHRALSGGVMNSEGSAGTETADPGSRLASYTMVYMAVGHTWVFTTMMSP